MPKDSIDDLIAAIDAVEDLKDALAKQAKSIKLILNDIDLLRGRIAVLETRPAAPSSSLCSPYSAALAASSPAQPTPRPFSTPAT